MHKSIYNTLPLFLTLLFSVTLQVSAGATGLSKSKIAAVGDDPVILDITCVNGEPGDQICLEIFVQNFDDMAGAQFAIVWDPNVLDYVDIQNEALSGSFFSQQGPNEVRYLWTDASALGVTLPNNSLLFEICFEIIGAPGSSSPIQIIDLVSFPIEISNDDSQILEVIVNDCTVEVDPATQLSAFVNSCGPAGGVGDGSFDITVFGGSPGYTIDWVNSTMPGVNGTTNIGTSGGMSTVNTIPGTYNITVTDNTGAVFMISVTIEDESFFAILTGSDPFCYDFTNGRISIEATGGLPPYGFVWEHTTNPTYHGAGYVFIDGGSSIIPSLPGGVYNITITDNRGCEQVEQVTIGAEPFQIDAIITDATCEGSIDGEVTLSFGGSTPGPGGYDITWMSSQITGNGLQAQQLNPGTYNVTISDQLGCDTVYTFEIGATVEITGDIQVMGVSCLGAADGGAVITGLTNGSATGPYGFTVEDADGNGVTGTTNATTITLTNLSAGDYTVVISEGPCASEVLTFTVGESDPLMIELVNLKPNSCLATNDGMIEVATNGGTPGYTYSWNGGALMGATINNLATGNYTVTVTDANGCTGSAAYFVNQAMGPRIDSIVVEDISCVGDPTASLTVYYTEGSEPVTTIQWNNGGTTPTISNLEPGVYTVTIRDDLFCFDIESFTVPGAGAMVMDSLVIEPPSCAGESDAQVTVYASGAAEPFTYEWSTGETTSFNLLPGLSAGTYSVTVFDEELCSSVDSTFTIADPEGLALQFDAIDSASCVSNCDGAATITPSGGEPGIDYQFVWETGQIDNGPSSTGINLCAGFQSVTVTQDGFCFFVDSVMVPAPLPVDFLADLTDVSCNGADDGTANLNISGGDPGYTVTWQGLPNGETQANLAAGTYYLTITDAANCFIEDSVSITEPDSLIIAIDSTSFKPISCGDTDDGIIAVEASGGNPGGYTYTWDPDLTQGQIATNLGAGVYQITVTDSNNCTDSISVNLTAPDPIIATLAQVVPPQCSGELTDISIESVMGGNGPYFFTINSTGHFDIDESVSVTAGIYEILVQDNSGCSDDTTLIIDDPGPIEIAVFPENPVVQLGDSLGLSLDIDNINNPIASILWSNSGPLSCYDCPNPMAYNIQPSTYTVTVTDTAGCTSTIEVFVDVDTRRFVFIPNVFSPNRDGFNDVFRVFTGGDGVEMINSMRIYDRWGEQVFEMNNILPSEDGTDGWDGTYKGKMLMPGVYVYVVEVMFRDNAVLVYRGDVTLVR